MVDIPESLLRRSAEAKAKALGVPVEQVLAEMKGEGPPVEVPQTEPPAVEEAAPASETDDKVPEESRAAMVAASADEEVAVADATALEETPAAVATVEASESEATLPQGNGGGKLAGVVSTRPSVPPTGLPEGVRTQRLLTVVKAGAIQDVKSEPIDKVNTWPHLMLMEFGALLLITGLLVIMSVVIHSPLLDPANVNATPNPSKAPWYFLGLQELLSYFDPQIAGVMVPTFTGIIGFMMIPFVDKNPSNRPSDRKFAILLYSIFLAGSATLTMFGVLFRGRGFNFSYPWKDGIFFDDLKDWVDFE